MKLPELKEWQAAETNLRDAMKACCALLPTEQSFALQLGEFSQALLAWKALMPRPRVLQSVPDLRSRRESGDYRPGPNSDG